MAPPKQPQGAATGPSGLSGSLIAAIASSSATSPAEAHGSAAPASTGTASGELLGPLGGMGAMPEVPPALAPVDEPSARLTFRWPLEVVQITSPYGRRANPFARRKHRKRGGGGRMHKGVDLNGSVGDQVLAAAGGRVKQAGWYYGFGKHVSIEHPGGFITRYAHLSEVLVYPGQRVRSGSPIGLVGSTGHSTGPHLHFGLERNGKTVDPRRYVGKAQEALAFPSAAPVNLDAPTGAPPPATGPAVAANRSE